MTIIREAILQYGFAVFCTAVATWIRVELTPYIDDHIPFGTFFLSVIMVAWLAGPAPAMLALFLSMLAAAHYIVAPENSYLIEHRSDQLSMLIFLLVGSISIALFYRLDSQREVAEQEAEKNELLNKKLLEADQRKDEFLSLLSHELRCPLAPMGYAVDTLGKIPDDVEQVKAASQLLARNLKHLVRLVDDLLDVSRYSRGEITLHRAAVDFRTCVESAIEMVKPAAELKQHGLFVDLPDQRVELNIDSVRCCQIICNLLTNAVKYTPPQGRIQVSLEINSDGVATIIEDNGIGISDAIRQQVFEPFYQVHSKRSRFSSGMGLGLAIGKKLAGLHGGGIEVHSEGLGRGSIFRFQLPPSPLPSPPIESCDEKAERPSVPSVEVPPLAEKGLASSKLALANEEATDGNKLTCLDSESWDSVYGCADNLEKPRVLIVDDDCDTANSLSFLLNLEGFETKVAHDGLQAMHECRNFRPQHIVLDIGLPGIDGYETAKRLRLQKSSQDAKIIAVSGWGNQQDREMGVRAGFDAHLVKPITVAQLIPLLVGNTSGAIRT